MNGKPNAARDAVSLPEFLNGIFDLREWRVHPLSVHLASFPGSPRGPEAKWAGFRWAFRQGEAWHHWQELPDGDNQYFSIGLLQGGSIGRADKLVTTNPLVVLDDVGTKVPLRLVRELVTEQGLLPAAVVETSKGNFSIYYKVHERFDLDRGARVRAALCGLGLSDPAVHDRSRYMRLPYGLNGKDPAAPFPVRLVHWAPGFVTSYDDWERAIAAAGGSTVRVHLPHVGERQASMDDPWVQLAAEVGLDPHETRPGVVEADCPFADEHTAGIADGFAFVNWGHCHCFHGSCQSRTTPDFLAKLSAIYQEQTGLRGADFIAAQSFPDDQPTLDEFPRKIP